MLKSILGFNRVILTMVVVDFFVNGALGTIAPFFAIFITQQISEGSATIVGFASAVYWLTKSIIQLPISRFLDKTDGERDEFWAFFGGYMVAAFIPVLYYFATQPWHLYLIQAIFGFAMAWAIPAWYSIFTRHIDKFRVSFEWSLFSVFAVGISSTLASVIGGILVDRFGFRIVFLIASVIMFASAIGILSIKNKVFTKRERLEKVMPEYRRGHRHY